MLFKYKGIDKNGKKISSKIQALNLQEAKAKLKSQGIIYSFLKEQRDFSLLSKELTRKPNINPNDLADISRTISVYLSAGISLVNTITLLRNRYKKNKKLKVFFSSISDLLDEGKNLYQALETQNTYSLPAFFKQTIKVSEQGGILSEVLMELSIYIKEQTRINKQVTNALAYPIFMILVAIAMISFMISFVVPKIQSIFTQLNQKLPAITNFVIGLSDFLSSNYMFIMLFLIFISICHIVFLKYSNSYKYFCHYFLLKLPFFGDIIHNAELARFSYVSSLLFKSGIPLVKSVSLSSNILNNEVIKATFKNASSKVVEGDRLSIALNKEKFRINENFIEALCIAEDTSQVSYILSNLAKLYEEENKNRLDLMLSLLEPFLMLLVGGSIGFIVTAMLLPIFSMNIA